MNILITGVSKGLGAVIANEAIKEGHFVIGISRSENEMIQKFKESNQFKHIKYDLSNSQNLKKEIFQSNIGFDFPIHAFINNAAIAYDDIVTNLKYDPLLEMYNVNVFSPMLITREIIRLMLFHKIQGSLIHISSVCAHTGYKGLAMYASSKGALEAFSKTTAREWGSKGIRSNCIAPGFMETEMSQNLNHEQKERIYNRTSLKKETDSLSVAKSCLFLASEDAKSITGQTILVDNGTI